MTCLPFTVRSIGAPIIAAINGHAVGAGLCVSLGCDIRVASRDAKLGVNFVRIGIHPGMGATYFLPRLLGTSGAARLLLTGDLIDATEAYRLRLVSQVCNTADETRNAAIETALSIAQASDVAVRELLATLRGHDAELDKALQREAEAQATCYADGTDLRNAIDAMRGKK